MEIKDKEFHVTFDPTSGRISIRGMLRLMAKDYRPIQDLLDHVARNPPAALHVDLADLKMINSSGLNTLSRFVLSLRAKADLQVTFHGARDTVWHVKTLQNMKHFLPSADIVYR